MQKKIFFLFIALSFVALCFLTTDGVFAMGPSGQAGKSNIGRLYLVEKDPITWEIIPKKNGGAWGKMIYRLKSPKFKFVFNGHRLVPDTDYTLIYFPDPWPGYGLICLGSDIASNEPDDNDVGNVHIAGSLELNTDLPALFDYNNPDNLNHIDCITNSSCINGAKIWLVLSSDVECTGAYMTGWNPSEYLFEFNGITYDDTDIP